MRLTRRFLADGTMWRGTPLYIGVVGNHLIDEIVFDIPVELRDSMLFLKVGTEHPGKIALTATEDGFLWTMRRGELTETETLCQLQAEKAANDDVIVWQSRPFIVLLAEMIAADEAIEADSLPYLQALDMRVAANADRAEAAADRAEQSGGGSIGNAGVADIDGLQAALDGKADAESVAAHTLNRENPHDVTAAQIGAAGVDHAHDVSEVTGLVETLTGKANTTGLTAHIENQENPHGVTAVQIGAADAEHAHGISDIDELQANLDAKADSAHSHTPEDVNGLADQLDNAARFAVLLSGWIGDGVTPISADAFSLDTATGSVNCSENVQVEFAINPETGELIQLGEANGIAFRLIDGALEVLTNAE